MRLDEIQSKTPVSDITKDIAFDKSLYQKVIKIINKRIKLGDLGATAAKRSVIKRWKTGDRIAQGYNADLSKINLSISDVLK